eukprot:Rhum_TRINITY_DN9701_c0_g1::Rhum_TRINITY_DN9701_c0_g1_i1::g.34748::m.34748
MEYQEPKRPLKEVETCPQYHKELRERREEAAPRRVPVQCAKTMPESSHLQKRVTRQNRLIQQKQQKHRTVAPPDARVQPPAVVVEGVHAAAAVHAVPGPQRLHRVARAAEGPLRRSGALGAGVAHHHTAHARVATGVLPLRAQVPGVGPHQPGEESCLRQQLHEAAPYRRLVRQRPVPVHPGEHLCGHHQVRGHERVGQHAAVRPPASARSAAAAAACRGACADVPLAQGAQQLVLGEGQGGVVDGVGGQRAEAAVPPPFGGRRRSRRRAVTRETLLHRRDSPRGGEGEKGRGRVQNFTVFFSSSPPSSTKGRVSLLLTCRCPWGCRGGGGLCKGYSCNEVQIL